MENKKLIMREMVCYSIGGITVNVYLRFIALFAIVFYTDVLGISVTLAGLIFMGSRAFDDVNDIAVGYISDRYGHYKRWILYGSITTAVVFVVMFTNFHLSTKTQSVYTLAAFCSWTLMCMCYVILFNTFASAMTQNTEERILLNSIRFAIVAVLSLIISLAMSYLKSGTQESDSTYGNIALVFAVIATICTLIYVAGIVERVKAPTARQCISDKEYLKAIPKNRQLLVVSVTFFCRTLGYYIYSSSIACYFNCYPGSAKLMGITLGMLAPIFTMAALCVTPMSRYIGKKKALTGCGVIFALSSVTRYFMPSNITMVAVTCWIGMFVMSATLAISFIMIADTTDYGVWLTGKNARAINYSLYTPYQKVGMAFSGTIVGILLDMAGYVPNQQQTDVALRGIFNIYCLIPTAIYLIMTAFMLLWKPDEGRMYEIVARLEVRRRLETND